MIEDDLRALLAERARDLPGNPARPAEVQTRIRAAHRRRLAGAALGVVFVVLASLLVVRWPGSNEAQPPAAPYFDPLGVATVRGYSAINSATPAFTRPEERLVIIQPGGSFRYLLVVRCPSPASLTVRNLGNDATVKVHCSQPVADHFEGAARFGGRRADALFAQTSSGGNIRYEPGSPGAWEAAVLRSNDADRLAPKAAAGGPWLAEGTRTRSGTTVPVTIPPKRSEFRDIAMSIVTECVAGVRLAFSMPAGPLITADCDPTRSAGGPTDMYDGKVQVFVTEAVLDGLGVSPGQQVPLTIRSVGRDTDQWRVFPIS